MNFLCSLQTTFCDIAGDNMNISRQHAKIAYNFALGKFIFVAGLLDTAVCSVNDCLLPATYALTCLIYFQVSLS